MGQVGIPTLYKGTRFRSRLEAKWAAFFDLLRWPWEYEPFDCNGWIPDFILLGKTPILIEVKPIIPIVEHAQYLGCVIGGDPDSAITTKINNADQEHEILLVGISPSWCRYNNSYIGWLRYIFYEDGSGYTSVKDELSDNIPLFGWSEAALVKQTSSYDFSDTGFYYGRMSKEWNWDLVDINPKQEILQALWAEAQNETQWKKK